MAVLKFLSEDKLRSFIDPDAYSVIDYLLKKVAFSQPESDDVSKKNGIQITKEFLEQWIAQACGLKTIGAGNYAIDNYKQGEYGVDVKFVSTKTNSEGGLVLVESNESSLAQNFKGFGNRLDQLFESKEFDAILKGWIDILKLKLQKPLKDLSLHTLYYFIFIRAGNQIHLAIAEVDTTLFDSLRVKNSTLTSVFVDNYIEPEFGNVKIYKSKKRMELRLFAKNLQNRNLLITWDFSDLYPSYVSLREIIKEDKLKNHIEEEVKKYFGN